MESTSKTSTASSTFLARQHNELKKNLGKTLSSARVALCGKITLKFPHFQGFLAEYSSNISMTGMFVRSESPEPPGTLVAFEFLLPEGVKLIQGQAEVVWVRDRDEGPDRPPGMGLRFVRLDTESRRLVRWTVEKHIAETGRPVELRDLLGAGKHGLNGRDLDLRRMYPYAGSAVARPRRERRRFNAFGAAAAAVLASVVFGGFLYSAQERRTRPAATNHGAPPAVASAEAAALTIEQQAEAELLGTVEAWAEAWSQQRADEYLTFYSSYFLPQETDRTDWEARRRSRISGPSYIRLRIADLAAELLSPERARVAFLQVYESDSYRDTVHKTLVLALESGHWKILEELSEAVDPSREPRHPAASGAWRQAPQVPLAPASTARHAKVASSSIPQR